MLKSLKVLGLLAAFAACVALVIVGQMNRGPVWLGIMFIGLAGLLVMLYFYNRKYTRADRLAKKKSK